MSFTIQGTGSALPARTVTNADLSAFLDTSDQWITTRTGIRERRVLTDESLQDLAVGAARGAMEEAGIDGAALSLIICATIQSDNLTPSLACQVQRAVGASCPAFDINAACSGFLYALDIARAYYAAGSTGRILIVCAEAMSRVLDWADRSTCVLFGDGAGAVVLAPGDGLKYLRLTARGGDDILCIPAGRRKNPFSDAEASTRLLMNGQQVYRFAVAAVCAEVETALHACGMAGDDITHYLLHQANIRILQVVRERLAQPEEKFHINIDRTGNTSAASIPLLLDETNRAGRLKPGDTLLLSAFGGGLTTGVCILRWGRRVQES